MSYTITIKSDNPEFPVDERMQDGMTCSGYMLVLFDNDGDPIVETLNGVSTYSVARYLAADKGQVSNVIRQANAISDGIRTAQEIKSAKDREMPEPLSFGPSAEIASKIISDILKKGKRE